MTHDQLARPSNRLDPETSWTVVTEAPLKGLGLAREAGTIFAWDEADRIYQIDLKGEYLSVSRAPGKVSAAVVSDDGSRIALLGSGNRLWLLDADLNIVAERQAPADPLALAIDPHGDYAVVSSKLGTTHFYNRFGKAAGKFETIQPLAFLTFAASRPLLIGCAAYGLIVAMELGGSANRLSAEAIWHDRNISGLGRLTTTGDGSMILASCFAMGVQRYDAHGQNAGAYHLGGTATHAVPDFAGRIIAVASAEGQLSLINAAGNVRWKSGLGRPAIALETDPLGRYLIYGQATGEITRVDLYAGERPARASKVKARVSGPADSRVPAGVGSVVRKPDWILPVATTDDQAETAVLTVLDDPPRVGVLTSAMRLQIITAEGRNLGLAPEIAGIGRIARTAPGWLAAATDRQVMLFDANKNAAQKLDLSLVEITHLAIQPDSFGVAVVQERDRIGRATIAGRWIWKHELKSAVEDLAIGPDGYLAMTDDAGTLTIFNPAGSPAGTYQAEPSEPLCLIEATEGADADVGVVWLTLARRAEVLRGHDLRGRVVWESPVPWEGWQFLRLGGSAAVVAPDGRIVVYDGSGHLRGQGRASEGTRDLLAANPRGEPRRVSRQGMNLISADIDGRVRWRAVADEPLGPAAVGQSGVAVFIGRSLAWFSGLD